MDLIAIAVGLVTMLGVAVVNDVRFRRIPNAATVGGLGYALVVRGFPGGLTLHEGLLGAVFGFVVFVPFWLLNGLGGGDVKLLTAIGAFLGINTPLAPLSEFEVWEQPYFVAIMSAAIIGAIMALITAARRGALTRTLLGVKDLVVGLAQRAVRSSDAKKLPSLDDPEGIRNPYGVAIAAGALIGLLEFL